MKPRYTEIVSELATAIREGDYASGTRLPTHRALARQHRISVATASRVYAELESMGLVSGEPGRGTFVRDITFPPGQGSDQTALDPDVIDLNFNYPSLSHQGELLRDGLRKLASQGDIASLLRYQPHAGRYSEREVFARYLQAKGFSPAPENVLIVNGAQHGLSVTLMAMLKPGDRVAVDALTYPGFKMLARALYLELVPIPQGQNGPDLSALEQQCRLRPVRAVYAMPTMHNPLGWVISQAARKKLASLAEQYDLLLIEDASYAYLAPHAPPPLAAFAPDRTVYVTSFSKNIATGLRVGALAVPPRWLSRFERILRVTTWNTPSLMTALVSDWLQNGTVNRLEILKRRDARRRQRVAHSMLSPLNTVTHPGAYFIWVPLAEEVRAERVASRLLAAKIAVSTAEPFRTTLHTPQAIRLALGSVSTEILSMAAGRVREVIEDEAGRR